MVFVQDHHTKAEVSSPHWLQVPSNMHGGACVVSWASEGGSVTLQRQLEKKWEILASNLCVGELFATVPWATKRHVRLFSKDHFECIKSSNWHAGQQMTVLKIICCLGPLFQRWFYSVHRTVCSPFLTTVMLTLASAESCFYDFSCAGRSLLGYFTGQCVLNCAKEEIICGYSCTYLYFHKSSTLLEIRPNFK